MCALRIIELRMLIGVHFWVFNSKGPPQLPDAHDLENVKEDSPRPYEDDVTILGGEGEARH